MRAIIISFLTTACFSHFFKLDILIVAVGCGEGDGSGVCALCTLLLFINVLVLGVGRVKPSAQANLVSQLRRSFVGRSFISKKPGLREMQMLLRKIIRLHHSLSSTKMTSLSRGQTPATDL